MIYWSDKNINSGEYLSQLHLTGNRGTRHGRILQKHNRRVKKEQQFDEVWFLSTRSETTVVPTNLINNIRTSRRTSKRKNHAEAHYLPHSALD